MSEKDHKREPFRDTPSPPLLSLPLSQFSPKHPRSRPRRVPRNGVRSFTSHRPPARAYARGRQTRTWTMDYSTPLLLIFGGCCSSVLSYPPLSSPLITLFASQERMDVRAASQADLKHRPCPHLLPNALHHHPILALFRRMAQISPGYRLSRLEAAPGPHFALGHSSLSTHDRFAPQQLGVCVPCTVDRADRVPLRRYAENEFN